MGIFRHLFNDVFQSPQIPTHISNKGHPFLKKCSKLNLDLENTKKVEKIFFISEINASEYVAINCLC